MSLFTIDNIRLLFLIHSCTAQNTYDITYEPSGEIIWRSTSNFNPQVATSYGEIRLGQYMSIEFDFKYEGRSSSFENQFFRIGAPATTTGCDAQESKYPSMWLKYGAGAILDIQFSGDETCTTKNYLSDYGNLNLNADHHIIIALNNTNITITITGGGVGKTDPYIQSWSRDPTPVNLLGTNVFVWWAGDKAVDDYDLALGTFSNIIIKTNIFTFSPTFAPTTTANPTHTPTYIPTSSPTSYTNTPTTFTTNPSRQPTHSPTYTPTTSTPTFTPTTSMPTYSPTGDTVSPTQAPFTPSPSQSPTTASPTVAPTTASPTYGPTTAIPTEFPPTMSPTYNPSKYPTKSPINDGVIAEISTTLAGNDEGDGKTSDNSVSLDTTSIVIIMAVAMVSLCIICGVIILCKQQKQKNQTESIAKSDNYRERNDIQMGENDINVITDINIIYDDENNNGTSSPYTPDGMIKPTGMVLQLADNDQNQKQYLSAAQKEALQEATPGGPNDHLSAAQREEIHVTGGAGSSYDNSDMYQEPDDYMSAAQREEINKNNKVTTGGYSNDNKGDVIVSLDHVNENDNDNFNVLMDGDDNNEFIIGSEDRTSDEEVLDNMVSTPHGNDDDGDGDGNEVQFEAQPPMVKVGDAYGKVISLSEVNEGKADEGVEIEEKITIGAMDDGLDEWMVEQCNKDIDDENHVTIDAIYDDDGDGDDDYEEDSGGDDDDDNFETIQ